jgi:twitching motility protein PilT
MAFGFKFGGQSPVQKLLAGKVPEADKQALLAQLTSTPAEELAALVLCDDAAIAQRGSQLFQARADAAGVRTLLEAMSESAAGFANGLKTLQKCKDELVAPALDTLFENIKGDAVKKVWEIALDVSPNVSGPYLTRALVEAPGPQRVAALKRISKLKGPEEFKAVLLGCLDSNESTLRKEAVLQLSAMQGEDIFNALLERVSTDDSKEVREAAGAYLNQSIARAPADKRPQALGRMILAGEPAARAQLVQGMFSQGNPAELLSGVLVFLKTLTGAQHRTVVDALKTLPALLPHAVGNFKNADADVRAQAVALVEAYANPSTTPHLVQLLRDPDWWVRIAVCEALGRVRDVQALGALREQVADPDSRFAAIEAVGKIGTGAALSVLHPLLKDPSPEVRQAAVEALAKTKEPQAEALLAEVAAKDPSIDVKLKAVDAMRELKGGEAKEGAVLSSKDLTKPIDKMLAYMRERGGSDLHITPGEPPVIRVNGVLERIQSGKLEAEHCKQALYEILDPVRRPILESPVGAVDLCYAINGVGRYRTNIFRMKRGLAAVFRTIPNKAPTIAELGLPKTLNDIGTYHQGVVLVTGPAGAGKTTTLTALINLLNETREGHVLTFEDPVEFVHTPKKALVNQREIGRDSASYASAMRGALREDPDVIVVGDMRDPETIRLALLASETGHLVVATMQTTGAVATIDKLVESFPPEEQDQVRTSLSESLKLVVSQVLVPRADGKTRVAAFEVLKSTTSVRSLIRDGKTFQLPSTMVIGRAQGMLTLDGSLEHLWKTNVITYEAAYQFAQNKEQFAKLKNPGPTGAGAVPGAARAPVAPPMARPAAPALQRPTVPAQAAPAAPRPAPQVLTRKP